MHSSHTVTTHDGRALRVHDSGLVDADTTLLWHIGSPQTGALLAPVADAAAERGIRLISYGRPGYGGSTRQEGRDVASATSDVAAIAAALGLDRFASVGASGGGPHALASALLPAVTSVVTLAGVAPFSTEWDWFAGMAAPAGLQAACHGVEARAAFALVDEFDPASFIQRDYDMFDGPWSALGDDVAAAAEWGDVGLIDDDVAFTKPWGFSLDAVRCPVLVIQGEKDAVIPASHGRHLAAALPHAELELHPDDGHVSVLAAVPSAMDWVLSRQ